MTTSSLRTNSSSLMAAPETAVVKAIQPVLERIEFPGRASMRALALALGSVTAAVEAKRTLGAGGELVFWLEAGRRGQTWGPQQRGGPNAGAGVRRIGRKTLLEGRKGRCWTQQGGGGGKALELRRYKLGQTFTPPRRLLEILLSLFVHLQERKWLNKGEGCIQRSKA